MVAGSSCCNDANGGGAGCWGRQMSARAATAVLFERQQRRQRQFCRKAAVVEAESGSCSIDAVERMKVFVDLEAGAASEVVKNYYFINK